MNETSRYFVRIGWFYRLLHGVLMTTFLGLAATGMPIRFNQAPWASTLAGAMGGFGTIFFFHKLFAVVMTLAFLVHLGQVFYRAFVRGERGLFWGPTSMVPQPRDVVDVLRQFRWFFGLGPRPRFDRYTYWEKFDYWAVFWGMAIIGTTGYMLWFSGWFALLVPGWAFNIALLIHSEEALLAVCFIFAIHFFNSHLRLEKFPMDLVIFTGRVSETELREERPLEYERSVREASLEDAEIDPPPLWLRNFGRIVGTTAVAIGFTLLGLILWAL